MRKRRTALPFVILGVFLGAGGLAAFQHGWIVRRVLIRAGLAKKPANLLRNAGFLQATNGCFPDYWGTTAPSQIRDWPRRFGLERDAPVPGIRALRIDNPGGAGEIRVCSFNNAMDLAVPEGGPLTLSLYLKASSPARVRLGQLNTPISRMKELRVGPEWQRFAYSETARPSPAGTLPYLGGYLEFSAPVTLWIAGAQLERGSQPTPFSLALMDDRPLPVYPWPARDLRTTEPAPPGIEAMVERSFYAPGEPARVRLVSHLPSACQASIEIAGGEGPARSFKVPLGAGESRWAPLDEPAPELAHARGRGASRASSALPPRAKPYPPGRVPFHPDGRRRSAGEYQLHVLALDAAGQIAARAEDRLVIVPEGNVGGVPVDRVRRCLLVDGRPFAARAALLDFMVDPTSTWQFEDLRDRGYNTVALNVAPEKQDAASLELLRGRLNAAGRLGLRVVCRFHPDYGVSYEAHRRGILQTMATLRAHPALLAWLLVDEPGIWWQHRTDRTREGLRRLYEEARRTDRSHPVYINEYAWTPGEGGYATIRNTDIGSLDCLPIGLYQNSVAALAEKFPPIDRDCAAAGKPMGFFTQLDGGMLTQAREPTLAEARAMAYLTAIYNVRLLIQYIYRPTSPEYWSSMKGVNAELGRIQELTMTEGFRQVEGGTRERKVHYALWSGAGRQYLIACNTAPQPVRAAFDLPREARAPARIELLAGGEGASLDHGRLTVPFPPLGRAFLELS